MEITKKIAKIRLSGLVSFLSLIMLSIWAISCSTDNKVDPLPGTNQPGDDVVNSAANGNYTFDKTHSNVEWHTFYYGDNALLTGRFNSFRVDVDFDEADIAGSKIDAWVQLSSFNTGEPGRDGYGKCGPGYMGVEWDTVALAAIPATDTAWFSSTSIVPYGSGYKAVGNLAFRNVTKSVDLFFTYSGESETQGSSGVTTRAGFSGHFDMLAKTDFGVTSSSIADLVTIEVNANYRKL